LPISSDRLSSWMRCTPRGELRDDVDLGAAVDLLSGPPLYRRVITHAPLDEAAADAIVEAAADAIVDAAVNRLAPGD
jgi:Tetracyclin repressor-like, C-terminal domain